MSRSVIDEIKQEIADNPIVLYMKGTKDFPQCGFSAATAAVLNEYKVPWKDVNILADQEKWMALKTFSDWPTMPQVYIGGQFIGGCDIIREMHSKGELTPLVENVKGK